MLKLKFSAGLLTLNGDYQNHLSPEQCKVLRSKSRYHDANRIEFYGIYFRAVSLFLTKNNIDYVDEARSYNELDLQFYFHDLFDHQLQSLNLWADFKKGIINFPTGAGKTVIAVHALKLIKRSTLVVVPTIPLMRQWQKVLEKAFKCQIGLIGDGQFDIQDIVVITYNSAAIYADKIGNRYCFIIYDEVHHLAADKNYSLSRHYIAPYRLGLSATLPEDDYKRKRLQEVVGEVVAAKKVSELTGSYLADYEVIIEKIELDATERAEYEKHRQIYLDYRNQFSPHISWQNFVIQASFSKKGQKAMDSFRKQKAIAYNCKAKYDYLQQLFAKYPQEKKLIFTNDNDSAKMISERFNLPLIIHSTKLSERKKIIAEFAKGQSMELVSTRVLNEGIDLPDVKIAIIFSGTGTKREHRQRLGRILRFKNNRRARLIELVTADTTEMYTSLRRNN